MKRLKAFWYVYRRSLIDVDYYKDLLKVKTDFSLKYFFSLAILATLLTTVRVAIPTVPKVQNVINNLLDEFSIIYPKDLVITVQNGMWEINKPEPFVIESPSFFSTDEDDFPDNLVVFDHRGTINYLDDFDAFMVVNDVNLIVVSSQNKVEAYPLDTLPDGDITKANVDQLINNVRSLTAYVPFIIVLFVLIGSFFYFLAFRLLYLLIVALVLLAMGNVMRMRESFKTYYRIALHTITLPLTVELAFILLGVDPNFAYWFLAFNVFFGLVVVHHLARTHAKVK